MTNLIEPGTENLLGVGDTCWKIAIGKERLAECPEHIAAAATSPLSNLLWSTVLSTEEAVDNSLCYGACPNGFEGDGPICWKSCPTGTFECGPLCQTPDQVCYGEQFEDFTHIMEDANDLAYSKDISGKPIIIAQLTTKYKFPVCPKDPYSAL